MAESTRVLIFGPCWMSAVAMVTCKLLRKEFGFYWANDWRSENRHRSGDRIWRRLSNAVNATLVQRLTERGAHWASFIITPSVDLYDRLRKGRTRVAMPVPLVKITSVISKPRDSCRSRAGDVRLLCVGELRRPKGLETLLKAFLEMKENGSRAPRTITMSIVGDGEMRAALQREIREKGYESDVLFHGHIADAKALAADYLSSSIFVLPSFSEGFPRVLYEAMAAGLPIVATSVGGIPALLRDGEDALIVPPGDPRAIPSAATRLTEDEGLYRTLSARGIRIFGERVADRIRTENGLAGQIAALLEMAPHAG